MADDAADLGRFSLFARLSAVELARLYPELEACSFAPGEAIYRTGDPPDALYLIRQGVVELRPQPHARPVGVLGPGESFGESALLSDEPRWIGAYAATPVQLWRLERDRFARLVEDHPLLALPIAETIARRLSARTRALAESQARLEELADRTIERLAPDDRWLLERLSVLERIRPDVAERLLGRPDAPAVLARLERDYPLILREDRTGAYVLDAPLRAALRRRLEAAEGATEFHRWQARAGAVLEAVGEWGPAVAAYVAAGQSGEAVRLALEVAEARRRAGGDAAVARWLEELPGDLVESTPALHGLRARIRAERDALGAEAGRGAIGEATVTGPRLPLRSAIGAALAALLFAALWLAPAPAGLSPTAMRVLAAIVASVPLFVLDVLPDYAVALLLLIGWAAAGLPGRTVLAGFASTSWFLVVATLGIGAAVGRSGLLYRAALWLVERLPPRPLALPAALAGLGVAFSPAMPNITARCALAGPVALEIAEVLRLPDRSPAAVRLGLATFLGFSQMGTLFLTGSTGGLLVYALLPAEARAELTWLDWLVGALPLHATIFVLTFAALALQYRPKNERAGRPAALAEQWRVLGPPSGVERAVGLAFVGLLVAFVALPLLGVDPAWPALAALVLLVAVGALDAGALREGVNWPLLLFLGTMIGLGDVFSAAGLGAWLGTLLEQWLPALTGSPALLLTGTALAGLALSTLVRWQAAAAILVVALAPLASGLGVHPWTLAICVLAGANTWLFPQQSAGYLALYHGTEGRLFSHAQVRGLALVYPLFVLLGILVSVPWWRTLGLLR